MNIPSRLIQLQLCLENIRLKRFKRFFKMFVSVFVCFTHGRKRNGKVGALPTVDVFSVALRLTSMAHLHHHARFSTTPAALTARRENATSSATPKVIILILGRNGRVF
jgi:hypothetical protein